MQWYKPRIPCILNTLRMYSIRVMQKQHAFECSGQCTVCLWCRFGIVKEQFLKDQSHTIQIPALSRSEQIKKVGNCLKTPLCPRLQAVCTLYPRPPPHHQSESHGESNLNHQNQNRKRFKSSLPTMKDLAVCPLATLK